MQCKWFYAHWLLIIQYSFTFRKYFSVYSGKKCIYFKMPFCMDYSFIPQPLFYVLLVEPRHHGEKKVQDADNLPVCCCSVSNIQRLWKSIPISAICRGKVVESAMILIFHLCNLWGISSVFLTLVLLFGPTDPGQDTEHGTETCSFQIAQGRLGLIGMFSTRKTSSLQGTTLVCPSCMEKATSECPGMWELQEISAV